MSYQNPVTGLHPEDGLYLIKQYLPEKGVDHEGVLDVGNRSRLANVPAGAEPVVIHQPPQGLRRDWLSTTGNWTMVRRIGDEPSALARVEIAARNPKYDLFANNCEHFAEFVATGEKKSPQLMKALAFGVGIAALAWLFTRPEIKGARA